MSAVDGFGGDYEDDAFWQAPGRPRPLVLGAAVQVWSVMHPEPTTVAMAAAAFHTSEEAIREAVDAHYWMFLDGDLIEHEGE